MDWLAAGFWFGLGWLASALWRGRGRATLPVIEVEIDLSPPARDAVTRAVEARLRRIRTGHEGGDD